MSQIVIKRERLPFHPLLGRNVNHDSRSRAYAVQPTATALTAVRHESAIGILDQGDLGSCTGNAGIGAVYRAPFTVGGKVVKPFRYTGDETGAVALYSRATVLDDIPGAMPQQDTGSDGLSIAKALKEAGIISAYQWAFTLQQALLQLQQNPLITGLPFYNSMMDVASDGIMTVSRTSGLAGGHELCVDEYRPATANSPAYVGGPNSWGSSWGDQGRWYLTVADWSGLLAEQGDVTSFVPAGQLTPRPTPAPDPAPQPAPLPVADAADQELWSDVQGWAHGRHIFSNANAEAAVLDWAGKKGLV